VTAGGLIFFADGKGGGGVEIPGCWRVEYEPSSITEHHKVTVRQILSTGRWEKQDTPNGGAATIFFGRDKTGSFYISRKIHFSLGRPWDPTGGKAADTGYLEDGTVAWTRSFHNGLQVGKKQDCSTTNRPGNRSKHL
jgi:hypothetical protein